MPNPTNAKSQIMDRDYVLRATNMGILLAKWQVQQHAKQGQALRHHHRKAWTGIARLPVQNKDRHCATTIAKLRRALRDCQDAKQGQALRHCATTIAKLGQALRKSMTVCGGIRDANVVMGLASVVGRARFCGVQQVLQFIPPL
jgi:hypothetical protein